MTDEDVVQTVAETVQGMDRARLNLRMVRKLSPNSNVWKVHCTADSQDAEFTLYVFPDISPEELSALTQERLILHLPRWQTNDSA